MVAGFASRGGYFCSTRISCVTAKERQREVVPDILQIASSWKRTLRTCCPQTSAISIHFAMRRENPINHPANIALQAYHALAEIRGVPLEVLANQVAKNFERFYG